MPRFSANLGFLWPDRPLLARIDAAAQAGFRAIELHWPYDVPALDIKASCERHGLTLLGLNTAIGDATKGEFGLGALAGRESDFQSVMDQSIAYCLASGATAIHAMAGVVPAEEHALAADVFVKNLKQAADKTALHDLTLLLEPINQRDKPGYFYSSIARGAEIIERSGKDNIKLMFDVYHVGVSEGDVLMKLRQYLPLIGHVQIAAVPTRAEPDEGEIAYREIFKALDAIGYKNWVGCEYKPRQTTDAGLGWVHTLGVEL